MAGPEYVISTHEGCIPHIANIDEKKWFKKRYLVYVDDLWYPGGYYFAQKTPVDINTFLQIPHPIILAFKNSRKPTKKAQKRALETQRGVYMLSRQEYDNLTSLARPSAFADFYTPEVDIKKPRNLQEAIIMLNEGLVIDTSFLNDISARGLVISLQKEVTIQSISEYSFDCACCAMHNKDYILYMQSINEMSSLSIIQNHNYRHLHLIIEMVKKCET